MTPLERLFRLEIEFYRTCRVEVRHLADAGAAHTSYALQNGYDGLIRGVPKNVTKQDVQALSDRSLLANDQRDVYHAKGSVLSLLGLGLG